MKKKAIVVSLLLCAIGLSAFAEVGTYFKGAVGYGYRWSMDWTTTSYDGETYSWKEVYGREGVDFNLFAHLVEVVPTIGIEPWRGSGNVFLRGLSFEISLDVGIGKAAISLSADGESETSDSVMAGVIAPKVMAVYTYRAGRVAPYIGVGVSVPIAIILEMLNESLTDIFEVGVNGNVMAGVGFMVTPSVMPVIEADFGFGSSMRIDARAGIVYRIDM